MKEPTHVWAVDLCEKLGNVNLHLCRYIQEEKGQSLERIRAALGAYDAVEKARLLIEKHLTQVPLPEPEEGPDGDLEKRREAYVLSHHSPDLTDPRD